MTPSELIEEYGRIRLTIKGRQGTLRQTYFTLKEALTVIGFYEKLGDNVRVW